MHLLGTGLYLTDLYPVVYTFKLFQIETINIDYRIKLFTHRAGVVGEKIPPSGTRAILETPLFPAEGGGSVEKIILKFN